MHTAGNALLNPRFGRPLTQGLKLIIGIIKPNSYTLVLPGCWVGMSQCEALIYLLSNICFIMYTWLHKHIISTALHNILSCVHYKWHIFALQILFASYLLLWLLLQTIAFTFYFYLYKIWLLLLLFLLNFTSINFNCSNCLEPQLMTSTTVI